MRTLFAIACLALAASLVACESAGVGQQCTAARVGTIAGTTTLASPALECPSRICYVRAGATGAPPARSVCTAPCTSDDDCRAAVTSTATGDGLCPRASGFVCAVATVTGASRCERFCVCRDDLDPALDGDVDGGMGTPPACSTTR